jgi:restriction endonuclease S subunit
MSNRKLPLSALTSENRDDFGYHDPQANRLIEYLRSKPETGTLDDCLLLIYRYPTFYGLEYLPDGEVRVVKGETIVESELTDNGEMDYISAEDAARFPRTILEAGDLVMSVRGTVGKVAVVPSEFAGSIINANLIRMQLRDNVDPYYLHAYLTSRIGQTLIERQTTKAIQSTITVPYIKAIPIWLPDKKTTQHGIAEILQEAYKKRKLLLDKAEKIGRGIGDYVLEKLGASILPPQEQWRSKVRLSRLQRRDDPEYYSPNRVETIELIRRLPYEYKLLSEIAPLTNNKINPQDYPEHIFHYLSLANVQSHTGELTGDTVVTGEDVLSQSSYFEAGDILFGRLRPYLNKVYFAEGNISKGICSTEFYVSHPSSEVEGIFLTHYLLSPLVLNQTKYAMAGSSLPRLPKQDFKEIEVPIVPLYRQREMVAEIRKQRALVRQRIQEADAIIDFAKHEVEKIILDDGFAFDEDNKSKKIMSPTPLPDYSTRQTPNN